MLTSNAVSEESLVPPYNFLALTILVSIVSSIVTSYPAWLIIAGIITVISVCFFGRRVAINRLNEE